MQNQIIESFEKNAFAERTEHPVFRAGDTVRVHYKIEESTSKGKGSDKEKKYRIQVFEGVCIRYRRGGVASSFTIRKIGSNSVGVERVFPLYSPYVAKVERMSAGRVRRSRLYYLRALSGKAARIRERRTH